MTTRHFERNGVVLYCGDCVKVMADMQAESVNCCVTSPPYWGLRDYGVDGQLGMESSSDDYVANLVAVFREVRRVLRDDGVLWVNLGDTYYDKQLCGTPWKTALALQADGWYLRSDIIWSKPNPMPSSVKDRCTVSHEYIFMLAKSQRYYYDAKAIAEQATYAGQSRGGSTNRYTQNNAGMDNKIYDTRNKRTVWTVNPVTYKGAHFATYPSKLIQPCILAGCPATGIVLDPFAGSGTTLAVAREAGRKSIGIELSPDSCDLAVNRLRQEVLF